MEKKYHIAIFDFDGTLFPYETLPYLLKQYNKLGYPKTRLVITYASLIRRVLWYKVSQGLGKFAYDKEIFRRNAFKDFLLLFKNSDYQEIQQFFDKNVEDIVKALDSEVVQRLKQLQSEGYTIILLSGCFEQILSLIAKALKVDLSIGTVLPYKIETCRKVLDFNKEIDVITGARKVAQIKSLPFEVNWEKSIAFADSYYDQDVLSLCGKAVCVNPDLRLAKIGIEMEWEIMKTKEMRKQQR